MNELFKKWTSTSLILRILVGLIIGAVLGLAAPGFSALTILGSVFVGALRAIAPVLVFILVTSSLANAGTGIGSRFRTVIALYMVSTLLAAAVSVVGSFLYPVSISLNVAAASNTPPDGIGEVLSNLLLNMVENPFAAIPGANYVGILFWAVIFGLTLKRVAAPSTLQMVADCSNTVSEAVRYVIQFAPFGIMGLVFSSVSENGLSIFYDYGRLLILLVSCMLVVALVIDPLMAAVLLRRNPYPLTFKCLKESAVTAFFTRSSAANIPINMALCEKLGLDRDFYSVSIPLGSTINMDGAAVTITVMTLATAHTLGIHVDIPSALVLSVIATLSACGASGVAGGSLLLIPMACALFGISNDVAMQVVAVGFIIGVVQDSVETALNSSGDVMFTATAEFHERLKRGEELPL